MSNIKQIRTFKEIPFKDGLNYEEACSIVLKALRKERELSQKDMGEILGISKSSYNKLENNNQHFRLSHVFMICHYLDIPRKEFLADVDLVFETSNQKDEE